MDAPPIQFARTADGVNIAFVQVGEGPPVLYMEGQGGNIERTWAADSPRRGHLERLSRRCSVIQYDRRGYGYSDRDDTAFTMENLLLDVEAVVNHLGLTDLTLMALSQAGPVAITYAAACPDLVVKLVLHGTYADGNALGGGFRSAAILPRFHPPELGSRFEGDGRALLAGRS